MESFTADVRPLMSSESQVRERGLPGTCKSVRKAQLEFGNFLSVSDIRTLFISSIDFDLTVEFYSDINCR